MADPIKEKDRSMEGFALRNQECLTKSVPVEFSGRMISNVCHNLSAHIKRFQHWTSKIWQSLSTSDVSRREWKSNEKITSKLTKKIGELNQKIHTLAKAISSPLSTKHLSDDLGNLNKDLESIKEMQETILNNNSIDRKLRDELERAYKYCSSDMQSLDRILKNQLQRETTEAQEINQLYQPLISSVPKPKPSSPLKRGVKKAKSPKLPDTHLTMQGLSPEKSSSTSAG